MLHRKNVDLDTESFCSYELKKLRVWIFQRLKGTYASSRLLFDLSI